MFFAIDDFHSPEAASTKRPSQFVQLFVRILLVNRIFPKNFYLLILVRIVDIYVKFLKALTLWCGSYK